LANLNEAGGGRRVSQNRVRRLAGGDPSSRGTFGWNAVDLTADRMIEILNTVAEEYQNEIFGTLIEGVRFAADLLVEGQGFESSVPLGPD
jgi:hypothetical protein